MAVERSADALLARDFRLREFPCWRLSTDEQRERLEESALRVLQPVRDRWGATVPSSWIRWSDGCRPRDGAHWLGGTVDFVVPGRDLREVWEWGIVSLLHRGYVGRWLLEPDHIHMAPVRDMIDAHGTAQSDILALELMPDGSWRVPPGGAPFGGPAEGTGTIEAPIEIEGIEVSVPRGGADGLPWGWWIGAGALVGLVLAELERRR